ncbi:hypothetical protein MBLNU230_g3183t1 [Neophaeotheca triangularis]
MNESLIEKWGKSKKASGPAGQRADVWLLPQRLNLAVREYYEKAPPPSNGWTARPEVPTSAEVLDTDGDSADSEVVEIVPNKREGAWESKEAYLSAHYELLREDALRPLRTAVGLLRVTPAGVEDTFSGSKSSIGIYEKVHICAITCSTRGIAVRVTFSLVRAGKQILWEQSKRLLSGSLVVLSPKDDMFNNKAIVATVAARPLSALQLNPPELDLFIARAEEFEFDPAQEWVMIEERSGFFEADRHTLLALQHMMHEPFPLSEHLVSAKTHIKAPQYVKDHPVKDMRKIFTNNKHQTYENVDILKNWPAQPESDLDASQLSALHRILTKRLAIVQGPPGTGKTHVSVQAIKVMLENRQEDDPPILVTCQTNHALDQLLRHIAVFEPDSFVRLGGRSKDKGIVKDRTLYEVRQKTSESPPPGCLTGGARKKMRELEKEITVLLDPLKPSETPLDHLFLQKLSLLTEQQASSLELGASEWVQDQNLNPNESPFNLWLGKSLIIVPPKQKAEDFGFEFEEADLEFEQLKELEAENFAKEDEDFESLSGNTYPIADNFMAKKVVGGPNETQAKEWLNKEQDLWKIPENVRGPVYRYLQMQMKQLILESLRGKVKAYDTQAFRRRIGFWEQDENILKEQKIIGMTTTGFSKYRALISALKPKVVLIEEAAETLEAPVIATCVPSLEQLILVGDHLQLRPHCHVREHQGKPFYLDISLFERMVRNNLEFETLARQRRMIPEIRRILFPIYKGVIKDHASVLNPANRPDVPGMGGINSHFFSHAWAETRDDHMSAVNAAEADMIVGFVEYLSLNGMNTKDITVLTFYNGQRKHILGKLRDRTNLMGQVFNVVTVDSYQGEENHVVLLSLVRSNNNHAIGFLDVQNRVCVALSRAQRGFYIFGNAELVYNSNKLWNEVITIMSGNHQKKSLNEPKGRLSDILPVRCSNHDVITEVADPSDWEKIAAGGCKQTCKDLLPCGHRCPLTCHSFPHDIVNCQHLCQKLLSCTHPCTASCGDPCVCSICSKSSQKKQQKKQKQLKGTNNTADEHSYTVHDLKPSSKLTSNGKTRGQQSSHSSSHENSNSRSSTSESWHSFAVEEAAKFAADAARPPAVSDKPVLAVTTNDATVAPASMADYKKQDPAPQRHDDLLIDFEPVVSPTDSITPTVARLNLGGAAGAGVMCGGLGSRESGVEKSKGIDAKKEHEDKDTEPEGEVEQDEKRDVKQVEDEEECLIDL